MQVHDHQTMVKTQSEIDSLNPFTPSIRPVCQAADWALILSTALAVFAAGVVAMILQLGALR